MCDILMSGGGHALAARRYSLTHSLMHLSICLFGLSICYRVNKDGVWKSTTRYAQSGAFLLTER
jgi:hypothetical protein